MGDIPIPYSRLNPIFTSLAPTIRTADYGSLGVQLLKLSVLCLSCARMDLFAWYWRF